MAQSSTTLHESNLSPETIDRHRAIVSIMEELEAVDWYDQRAQACHDPELKKLLEHNRDEEKEHAAMLLEWLRRHDDKLDAQLRKYLFKEALPSEVEEAAKAAKGGGAGSSSDGSLNIGRVRAPELKK